LRVNRTIHVMALPSQGGFSSVRQGGSYRRRRRSHGTSWLVLFVIAACTTWYLWPGRDSESSLDSPIPVTGEAETVATPSMAAREPRVEGPTTNVETPLMVPEEPRKDEPTTIVETTEVAPNVDIATIERKVAVPEPTESSSTSFLLMQRTSACLDVGMELLDRGRIVEARLQLSRCLQSGTLSESEVAQARGVLIDLSDGLVFSPYITEDDPYAIEYIVRSGDTLSGIVYKMGLHVDWRFIQRINQINKASSIRPGQNLKLITGPFHAVVDKATFRIDLYLGDGDEQVFVRSYRVGLGEFNSTPKGLFRVRKHSKLINPTWVNPRTGVFFSSDNMKNPIGERWIGLQGIDERTKHLSGLGIHGTIEPKSIGKNVSMGCVRMLSSDVEEVYEMLLEGVSTVAILEKTATGEARGI